LAGAYSTSTFSPTSYDGGLLLNEEVNETLAPLSASNMTTGV
jgi:hypothetical protein